MAAVMNTHMEKLHKTMEKYRDTRFKAIRFICALYGLKKHLDDIDGDGNTHLRIYFHDDADGFAGAALVYTILKDMGFSIDQGDLVLYTYDSGSEADLDMRPYALYVDIQPQTIKKNNLVIDHHRLIDEHFKYRLPVMELAEQTFIIWPEDEYEDLILPTSTSLLASYLLYVFQYLKSVGIEDLNALDRFLADLDPEKIGDMKNIYDFFYSKEWCRDHNMTYLVLIGLVSDNLWLLSLKEGMFLRNIVSEYFGNIDDFIKESMALSLMLGDKSACSLLVSFLYYMVSSENIVDIKEIIGKIVVPFMPMSNNLYGFARQIVDYTERSINYIKNKVETEIAELSKKINRIKGDLEQYKNSMPIQMKTSRDYTVGLMETQYNKSDLKWQRIEFFAKEIKRLENNLRIENNRLDALVEISHEIDNIKGIVIFLPEQSSEQVKGILSSLIYYFGKRNIVIEEHEGVAYWGSRGLSRDELERELTSFELETKKIDYYISISEMAKDLPNILKKSLNYFSDFVKSETKYVGGGGGRGLVFGGVIRGTVPQLLQMFAPQQLKEIMDELKQHNELAGALKALTEKGLRVPISKALKTKFMDSDWITILASKNGRQGDVMRCEVSRIEIWFRRYSVVFKT